MPTTTGGVLEQKSAEAITASIVNWFSKPDHRSLIPSDPNRLYDVLFSARHPGFQARFGAEEVAFAAADELSPAVEEALDAVDQALSSPDKDTRWTAMFLFGPILNAGETDRLRERCEKSNESREVWDSFTDSILRYAALAAQLASTPTATDAPPAPVQQKTLTAIIHGTRATNEEWWREVPGKRNFWSYINSKTKDCVGKSQEFQWSGGIYDGDRRQGAAAFIAWWKKQGKPNMRVIAHSHGANVIWYALTRESSLKIDSMISLGTPICVDYTLRLKQVTRIENVYSEHDGWQTTGASFTGMRGEGRTLPDSLQVTNYHVPDQDPNNPNSPNVGHSDLHEEFVWVNNGLDKLL